MKFRARAGPTGRTEFFYAFDPRRAAILLIGGNKTGDDHFYERMVPLADRIYDQHLRELNDETQPTDPTKRR